MKNLSPLSLRVLIVLSTLLCFAPLVARAQSQTTFALGFYGAFTGTTSGNGTVQSPSNQAGGIIELRYIANPFIGYELTYSYNRADQSYSFNSLKEDAKAGAHEISADWVVSFPIPASNFRPFVLAGGGVINFEPSDTQQGIFSDGDVALVYGGGVDWGVLPHFGLRAQYRGNLYHAPDLVQAARPTNAFANTSEPVIGAYIRF